MEGVKRSSMCYVGKQSTIDEDRDGEAPQTEFSQDSQQPPVREEEDTEDLSWHHHQLIKLYGREVADDIIYPKMERKQVTVDPNLGGKESHAGAAQLWSMLRNESNGKLLEEDHKIPNGLKESYGAFVRQLVLQKGQVPVKRNFFEKEDVPDMDHLVDRRNLMKTLDIRHKIELMGRSSKVNQDKTNILLYNNPIPDLVNASGDEGIDRYLPDYIDDDAESVATYRKWLGDERRIVPHVKPSDSLIELVRPITRDTSRHQGPPKVTFLTEAEAGAERGTFSDKYKTTKESGNSVTNPADNQSAILTEPVEEPKPFRGDSVKSGSGSQRSSTKVKKDPTWQPLTLNALVQYADKKKTIGAGQFRHGSMKMYSLQSANSQ